MIVEQILKNVYPNDRGCACCLTSHNAGMLESAEKLSVEVSVLRLREGRF